jgi:hypothetical protein
MVLSKFDKNLSVSRVAVFDALGFSYFIVQSNTSKSGKNRAATDESGNFSDLIISFAPSPTY